MNMNTSTEDRFRERMLTKYGISRIEADESPLPSDMPDARLPSHYVSLPSDARPRDHRLPSEIGTRIVLPSDLPSHAPKRGV